MLMAGESGRGGWTGMTQDRQWGLAASVNSGEPLRQPLATEPPCRGANGLLMA
jgi:hypothetical protein